MKLDRAIEILTTNALEPGSLLPSGYIVAVMIGVQAMKVLRHGRLSGAHHDPDLLPGETKD